MGSRRKRAHTAVQLAGIIKRTVPHRKRPLPVIFFQRRSPSSLRGMRGKHFGGLDSSRVFPQFRKTGLLARLHSPPPLPGTLRTQCCAGSLQWLGGFVRLTVAGPRRIFTGLPEHLPKEGARAFFLIVVRREGFVKARKSSCVFGIFAGMGYNTGKNLILHRRDDDDRKEF